VATDNVEVTDPPLVRETVTGFRLTVGPVGRIKEERLIVAAKLFKLVTVTIAVDEPLGTRVITPMPIDMAKSGPTVNGIRIEYERRPLVAVRLTTKDPAGVFAAAATANVEEAVLLARRLRVAGLVVTVGPFDPEGAMDAERATVPEKP
jgi:hypothetical protein